MGFKLLYFIAMHALYFYAMLKQLCTLNYASIAFKKMNIYKPTYLYTYI